MQCAFIIISSITAEIFRFKEALYYDIVNKLLGVANLFVIVLETANEEIRIHFPPVRMIPFQYHTSINM